MSWARAGPISLSLALCVLLGWAATVAAVEKPIELDDSYPTAKMNQEPDISNLASESQAATPSDSIFSRSPTEAEMKEIYRFRFQSGANFGGPFLLERWMNFGVFSGLPDWVGTSQDAFNRGVGDVGKLKARLEDLWLNYIPECDFAELASYGMNTIRLPVGYWIIGGKYPDVPMLPPFEQFTAAYVGAEDAVHRFFTIAAKYGIGVLLDLHGAPGSQNGADHSGVSGPINLYGSETNRRVTVATLKRFTQIYGNHTNLVGIEILNEPAENSQLTNIYRDAYAAIRQVDPSMPVYICDTVMSSNWNKWADFIVNSQWELAVLDVHPYYAFSGGGTPADSFINGIRNWERDRMTNLNNRIPTVSGEWSNAFNPGSYSGYDQQRRDGSRRNFFAQQLETHKRSNGYHFWTWHGDWAEGSDWDMRSLLRQGWATGNMWSFPTLVHCETAKRAAAQQALDNLPAASASGLASHRDYWLKTQPNREGGFDWDMYTAGFSEGYTTAVKFFYYADSKIASFRAGYAGWKAKLRKAELDAQGGNSTHIWQWKDGFSEGISGFNNFSSKW